MKILFVMFMLSGLVQAAPERDEVLSQKYENLFLDGEDREIIEDQMTTDGIATYEEVELQDYEGEEE